MITMAQTMTINNHHGGSKRFFSGKYFRLPTFLRRPRRSSSPNLQELQVDSPQSSSASSIRNNSPPQSYSDEDVPHWKKVFHHFDANGDGKISAEELTAVLTSIGDDAAMSASYTELEYGEFVRLMEAKASEDEKEAEIRRAFEMFEAEKGSGCITPTGLRAALRRLGEAPSHEDCTRMIGAYDVDGNGVVDYQEFRRMMACA